MANRTTSSALAAAVTALGLVLTGCGGSEPPTAESSSEQSSSSSPSSSASAAESTSSAASTSAESAPIQTVDDYLKENGIERTIVHRGDPGVPMVNLPLPAGWRDMGPDTPETAYGAIVLDDPALGNNTPAIIATMARLSGGEPDPAKILQLAPNALKKLPGYDGPETGIPDQLGGFEGVIASGLFDKDGAKWLIARKTVIIPGKDGMYLLALDAQGPEDQADAMITATEQIDAETTIEP